MKLALVGYGRMGRAVEAIALERGHEVVLRLTAADNVDAAGLTPARLAETDAAIEFTQPASAPANLKALAAAGVAAVTGTTGWYDRLAEVSDAVEGAGTGMLYAPNFSIGVQILFRLAQLTARLAERFAEYDASISEAHHRFKKDHPSGTARRLAEIVLAELSGKNAWVLAPGEGDLDPAALQVGVLRAGDVPGTHTLALDGPDDRIELRHEARGRTGFARGAVAAAEWLHGRQGVFTIDDMMDELLEAVPGKAHDER